MKGKKESAGQLHVAAVPQGGRANGVATPSPIISENWKSEPHQAPASLYGRSTVVKRSSHRVSRRRLTHSPGPSRKASFGRSRVRRSVR